MVFPQDRSPAPAGAGSSGPAQPLADAAAPVSGSGQAVRAARRLTLLVEGTIEHSGLVAVVTLYRWA